MAMPTSMDLLLEGVNAERHQVHQAQHRPMAEPSLMAMALAYPPPHPGNPPCLPCHQSDHVTPPIAVKPPMWYQIK